MAKAKSIQTLNPFALATAQGIKILRTRLLEMVALRRAALDFSDIEGVHDMRVASRRLRSAFADFEIVFQSDEFKTIEREARHIARALGAVRDQDVAIEALEKFARDAPPNIKTGIKTFIRERIALRNAARVKLKAAIDGQHLDTLVQHFDTFAARYEIDAHQAASTTARATQTGDGNKQSHISDDDTLIAAARSILRRRWRKLARQMRGSIYQPLEPEPLHDARIEAKRLRYALELFSECWRGSLTPFAKRISAMQTALGEVHDLDEWTMDFGARLTRRRKSANTRVNRDRLSPPENAAAYLISLCTEQRARFYREALALWIDWQRDDFARQLDLQLARQPARPSSTNRRAQTSSTKLSLTKTSPKTSTALTSTKTSIKKSPAKASAKRLARK